MVRILFLFWWVVRLTSCCDSLLNFDLLCLLLSRSSLATMPPHPLNYCCSSLYLLTLSAVLNSNKGIIRLLQWMCFCISHIQFIQTFASLFISEKNVRKYYRTLVHNRKNQNKNYNDIMSERFRSPATSRQDQEWRYWPLHCCRLVKVSQLNRN